MMPSDDLWAGSGSGRAGLRNTMWAGYRNDAFSGTPMRQYVGYYADRQKRFHIRSLRRDGVYFVDFPFVLWIENDWAPENGFCG
jgi:hypothetical protein